MKILNLELRNFKGTSSSAIAPKQVNALVGPNGSGKTTLLDAIRTAINGKTPEGHIMSGEKAAAIHIEIEGIGCVDRQWVDGKPAKTKLNGRTTTQKSINETIAHYYGFTAQTTDIMSSSEVVENLFGKDFAKYLLGFLKNDMDIDKLIALCGLSAEAENELRMQIPAAPALITLEDVDEAYNYYKDCRTETKRMVETTRNKAAYTGIIPTYRPKELEKAIEEASRQLGALQVSMQNYKTAEKNAEQQRQQIERLKTQISAITAKKPTESEVNNLRLAIAQANAMIARCVSDIQSRQNIKAQLQRILSALNKPLCPVSDKLTCTTDKTAIRGELEEQIAACDRQIQEATAAGKKAKADLNAMEEKMEAYRSRENDYKKRLILREQLEQTEQIKIEVPPKVDAASIAILENKLESWRQEYALAVAYEAAQEAEQCALRAEKELKIYEELAELLSPKGGARKKILEHNIAPLEAYCNERAAKILPKYSMKLDVSDGFRINFADTDGNLIPYEAISNGERLRALFILTDMLNALNGFRILICDNLDGLDTKSFSNLLDIICENKDDYDHIFISAVNYGSIVEEIRKRAEINLIEF